MAKWVKKRLESLLDNLVFAIIVAFCGAVWAWVVSMPFPLIAAIIAGTLIGTLILIRLILYFGERVKIFEIEVPKELQDKILGKSYPEGKTLELKGKYKRKYLNQNDKDLSE